MIKNDIYSNQPKNFWAYVRSISEEKGYTERKSHQVRSYSTKGIKEALNDRNLNSAEIFEPNGQFTELGKALKGYFDYRADVLNNYVEKQLMDANEASELFYKYKRELKPKCPLPNNKQKGDKKSPSFFTGIINIIIEANLGDFECDFNPRRLTTITSSRIPVRTLSRRVDGAFPNTLNPIAIWEIKEYYYTTTFGSRIADGVYETLLDGMELNELYDSTNINVFHYLMVDSHRTWWEQGKAYLCRIIDMLNMGFVDEVLFGREVIERLPKIVNSWLVKYQKDR